MGLPSTKIGAPTRVLDDLGDADPQSEALSVFGRAKKFGALRDFGNLKRLRLSGINQEHLDIVGTIPRIESLFIHDLRTKDLRSLAGVSSLSSLAIAGSPPLRSLDGLQTRSGLVSLILFDNCNYHDLAPLRPLVRLEVLCLEGGFSKDLRVDSLEPLSNLGDLRSLRLASIRVRAGGLRSLHDLKSLRDVFIAATFPKDELRLLAEALPDARGRFLDDFRTAG